MRKNRILIVEDERIVAHDVKMGLQRLGYSVSGIAVSGEESIEMAKNTHPDLILMDIVLEGSIDGIKAAEIIYKRFKIPVVYFTAYADRKTIERAKKTEPYGYIVKPFEDRELQSVIEIALYKHKLINMLEESEDKYKELADSISDVFFATDKDLRPTYWNKASEKLTEIKAEDALGKSIIEIFPNNEETRRAIKIYQEVLQTRKPQTFINEYHLAGKQHFFGISAYPSGRGLSVFIKDITDQKNTEEKLRASEAFNFALFQFNPIEIIVVDHAGKIIKTNLARRKSGDRWPNIGDVMYKDYAGKHEIDMHAELMECIVTKNVKRFPELKYGDKYLSIIMAPFPMGAIITSQDITKRKKAEEEIKNSQAQLRNLAAHLESIREQERTLVAREMHDELGQSLTALKMDLSWLRGKISKEQKPLRDKTKSMTKLVDRTLQSVKRISTELRPGLLDDIGLPAAIEWQAEEFENRMGIKCAVTVVPEDMILDSECSTAIFRIFQETLTNVVRHSHATQVKVGLKAKAGKIELKVRDNGNGITKKQIADPKSFGLIGIRERAQFLGGDVEIRGIPDKGTTVIATIPISKEREAQ
jgi:PAS domain S-box-containing protein